MPEVITLTAVGPDGRAAHLRVDDQNRVICAPCGASDELIEKLRVLAEEQHDDGYTENEATILEAIRLLT